MSTDLHLHNELPKLRIAAAVKLDDLPSDDEDHHRDEVSSVVTQTETTEEEVVPAATVDAVVVGVNDVVEDESYRTPTSKESKIPASMACPAAPKKPKGLVSCKRKLLDDFQFFDVTNKEDMDAFFRSTFPKRSCPCT